jgi:hypothetical protein
VSLQGPACATAEPAIASASRRAAAIAAISLLIVAFLPFRVGPRRSSNFPFQVRPGRRFGFERTTARPAAGAEGRMAGLKAKLVMGRKPFRSPDEKLAIVLCVLKAKRPRTTVPAGCR